MFLTRGNPVVYYGDEQGFTGPTSDFGDKRARQDMFATKTPIYQDDVIVGSSKPAGHGRALRHVVPALPARSRQLSALRAANPALADGAQVHRYASDAAGIYAISRIDKAAKREYVVVANNATTAEVRDLLDVLGRREVRAPARRHRATSAPTRPAASP